MIVQELYAGDRKSNGQFGWAIDTDHAGSGVFVVGGRYMDGAYVFTVNQSDTTTKRCGNTDSRPHFALNVGLDDALVLSGKEADLVQYQFSIAIHWTHMNKLLTFVCTTRK